MMTSNIVTTICGLDLSLTGAGVCILRDEAAPEVHVIRSKPIGNTLKQRRDRLAQHLDKVLYATGALDPEQEALYLVEGPSYGSVQGAQHDRSGFWWMVADEILTLPGAHLVEVPPTTVKKFSTGRGNASKEEVIVRAAIEYPGVDFIDDNGADALWLAAIGRAHQHPDTVTKARQAVLKTIAWGT